MTKGVGVLVFVWILFPCTAHPAAELPTRTIEIHAHRFAFAPADITVKRGETVHLKLISDDVPHSLLVKDFGIDQTITKSRPADVTFTPQHEGTFHGQCGRFCGSGHGRMTLTIHVNAK